MTTIVHVAGTTGSNTTSTGTGPTTTSTTIDMPADTLQLMGMASSLPTSNLFVNYPHTMWEKDAEGNRILIKSESSGAGSPSPSSNDLLSQAAASIKQEHHAGSGVSVGGESGGTSEVTLATVTPSGSGSDLGSTQTVLLPRALPPPKNPMQARPHLCDICNKGFVKREHLTKHLRIHKSDNKRYACEYCQKAFRDRYELVRHTRRHTGDFPFRSVVHLL